MLKPAPQNLTEEAQTPLQSFEEINAARLDRMRGSLSQRKATFLGALPVLLHYNEAALPGFVSNQTPVGIRDYSPTEDELTEARRVARNKDIGKRAQRKYEILGLYVMGSAGTIAYHNQSDLDVWLFIDHTLHADRVSELQEKCNNIENWALEQKIEVHFFLINPQTFRTGSTVPLSIESSGSAQHGLLLDEFYRTSIKIAGLPLMWWNVPPRDEAMYAEIVASEIHLGERRTEQFIDLGGLTHIQPEEFFGAAVWQLSKSFSAPYKSVMKLLLMEVYAHDATGAALLSHRFKKQVYSGTTDILELDPWIQMFDLIQVFLEEANDGKRLDILRRSFYLKLNDKISETHHIETWKRNLIREYIDQWGWDDEQVIELDNRAGWKLETVMRERASVIHALTNSYRFLSRYARHQAENPLISASDLTILGRRLYAAFERKAGKIEILNRGIAPDIHEPTVSLHYLTTLQGGASWVLYRGIIRAQELGDTTHLKRTANLIDMLTWAYFNGVLDQKSKIMLYLPKDNGVSQQEIKTILDALTQCFPSTENEISCDISNDALEQPVRLERAALFVNAGHTQTTDPFLSDTLVSSERSNALSFGGQHKNLAMSFDVIYQTSWGEVITHHYTGENALIECITDYLAWSPSADQGTAEMMQVFCYSPGYGAQIRQTLKAIFTDLIGHFSNRSIASAGSTEKAVTKQDGRYILEIENGFQSLELINDQSLHQRIENKSVLLNYLAQPQSHFVPVFFGPHACRETVLPYMYALNKPDTLQLFFYLKDLTAKIYVIDECGTFFFDQVAFNNKHALFGQFEQFAETIMARIAHEDLSAAFDDIEFKTELYQIDYEPKIQDLEKRFRISPLEVMHDRSNNFLKLQVLVDRNESRKDDLVIYCENNEFSTLEYGDYLFEAVADQVMKYRGSRLAYPVYITDIDIGSSVLNDTKVSHLQAAHLFEYKKSIEAQLTKALNKVSTFSSAR